MKIQYFLTQWKSMESFRPSQLISCFLWWCLSKNCGKLISFFSSWTLTLSTLIFWTYVNYVINKVSKNTKFSLKIFISCRNGEMTVSMVNFWEKYGFYQLTNIAGEDKFSDFCDHLKASPVVRTYGIIILTKNLAAWCDIFCQVNFFLLMQT